jgi:hypothetical protein
MTIKRNADAERRERARQLQEGNTIPAERELERVQESRTLYEQLEQSPVAATNANSWLTALPKVQVAPDEVVEAIEAYPVLAKLEQFVRSLTPGESPAL